MRINGVKTIVAAVLALTVLPGAACAGETTGGAALMLAALVGKTAPGLDGARKATLAALMDGRAVAAGALTVTAERVMCRASNVDIAAHACDLTFAGRAVTFSGRRAHELFATMLEAGAAPEGAAGSTYVEVKHLDCALDTSAIAERGGGGASCRWQGE